MKLLVLDPDFYKSALLINNKKRAFNHCIVAQKLLKIFEQQPTNGFETVPNYRVWRGYEEALKFYFNCLLRVCKEIHKINTKYEYFQLQEDFEFPCLSDLTFKSHQAYLLNLDYDNYKSVFKENEGFNGNILLWEYLGRDRDNNRISIAEDFNGIYKQEKFNSKDFEIKSDYNLKEINKNNIKLWV